MTGSFNATPPRTSRFQTSVSSVHKNSASAIPATFALVCGIFSMPLSENAQNGGLEMQSLFLSAILRAIPSLPCPPTLLTWRCKLKFCVRCLLNWLILFANVIGIVSYYGLSQLTLVLFKPDMTILLVTLDSAGHPSVIGLVLFSINQSLFLLDSIACAVF